MTQMFADTNAIETIAKLRRVMDEPAQNKFIGKIKKAITEIKNYLRNVFENDTRENTAGITAQLDCLQNIADLWAKGVANSMNEFETLAGKNKKEYSKSKSDSFDNVKWSIKKIVSESGKDYGIGVYLDSTLLEGLTDNERIAMVKEYIKELGGKSFNVLDQNGKIIDIKIVDGSSFINSKGKRIKANKDISTKYNKTKIKQDAIILINEMIETAEFSESKPSLYSHGWLDNNGKNNWEYYKVHIQEKNNSVWEATLNVTNSANGEKILYDIFPIKKKESGASVKSVASTNNIIRTNSEKSQEKFSLKTKTDEFRTNAMIWANSADTEVGDTKILSTGRSFALLEATENGFTEIARGNYKKVRYLYEQLHSEEDTSFYEDIEEIRTTRRGNMWDLFTPQDRGDVAENGEQIGRKGLQIDSSGNAEYLQSSDKGKSDNFSVKTIPNNRELLANALETVTKNDIERKYIRDYKSQINLLNEQEAKLKEINEEIGELAFAPGKRDTARLKELTEERIKTQNRINIYDKKLLRLEACLFYPFVL